MKPRIYKSYGEWILVFPVKNPTAQRHQYLSAWSFEQAVGWLPRVWAYLA